MKTIGIIAEYNPFHNGHLYQIDTIRKQTGAENIVIIMSGNFVQRGTPAFTDKYLRTKMALEGGADFVFELPVIYATASAELFALGGVSMLESLGFIDGICFGSECNDINTLNKIAELLLNGSESFDNAIAVFVKSGLSYPKARQCAIEKLFSEDIQNVENILASPNNILAIEYLKALKRLRSNIEPITIKRCDNGYNNSDYLDAINNFASATAIRSAFAKETLPLNIISDFIPKSTGNIFTNNPERINVNENYFSNILYYKLRSITENCATDESLNILTKYLDVSDTLAYRIVNNLNKYTGFSDFIQLIKTKQYTYSRISRCLIHILLNIYNCNINPKLMFNMENNRKTSDNNLMSYEITPYARLLGMNKNKSSLLRSLADTALITKVADADKCIEKTFMSDRHTIFSNIDNTNDAVIYKNKYVEFIQYAKEMFSKDVFASDLYRVTSADHLKMSGNGKKNTCPDEYRAGIILTE